MNNNNQITQETSNCQICLNPRDLPITLTCQHSFCKSCFDLSVQYSFKRSRQIICPQEDCDIQISSCDLKLSLSPEVFEEYLEFSLKNCQPTSPFEKRFNCRCNSTFMVHKDADYINCPRCQVQVCIFCKEDYHQKMSCELYQQLKHKSDDEKQFLLYASINGLKKCPNCQEFIEKVNGCNFITCNCECCFCYICSKILTQEDHYLHFINQDPWTNKCKSDQTDNQVQKLEYNLNEIECPACKTTQKGICEILANFDNHFCYCSSSICKGSFYCLRTFKKISSDDLFDHFQQSHLCQAIQQQQGGCNQF